MPVQEVSFAVCLHYDGAFEEGSVGQKDVVVGAFQCGKDCGFDGYLLRRPVRCGMPRSGWMGFGFSFTTCIVLRFG